MANIKSVMQNLYDINTELSRHQKQGQELRKRKKELEKQVLDWIQQNDQPGVKYKNMAFVAEKKKTHKKMKKSEKHDKLANTLKNAGVNNHGLVSSILESMKGEEEEKSVLRIVNR